MSYHPSQFRSAKRYRDTHKDLGLCTLCNKKATKGKTMCQDHLDKRSKSARDKRKK